MKTLLVVPGCNVPVIDNGDGSYSYTSHMMIDGDGTGSSHGDPDYQNATSYKPDLNADIDQYIVLPPCVFLAVAPQVMGCRATIRRKSTGDIIDAVVGDVGPHQKIGEASIACAAALGIPSSPTEGGDDAMDYEYTFRPGTPATVRDKTYILQSFA